uniref:BZIP domain-containing protein n=1 Tax=Amphiprion ocellaris TaxID=80972 RepID=A0AAQ5X4B5_AMPOC
MSVCSWMAEGGRRRQKVLRNKVKKRSWNAATGDIPAYQLRSPNSGLAQSIVMAASPGGMQSPSSQHAEEITRKREVRLMKNREAARECRRKKKEYVKCLENRVAVLENQNKTLIEELKALKDIYCHKAE